MFGFKIAIVVFVSLSAISFLGIKITSKLNKTWLDGISRDHFKSVRNLIGSLVSIGLDFMLITVKNNYDKKQMNLGWRHRRLYLFSELLMGMVINHSWQSKKLLPQLMVK